jgi:hypothetical protein
LINRKKQSCTPLLTVADNWGDNFSIEIVFDLPIVALDMWTQHPPLQLTQRTVFKTEQQKNAPISSEMRQAGYLLVASDIPKDPEPENEKYLEILAHGDFEICLYQPAIVTEVDRQTRKLMPRLPWAVPDREAFVSPARPGSP